MEVVFVVREVQGNDQRAFSLGVLLSVPMSA